MKYQLAIKRENEELFKTFVTVNYNKDYEYRDNLCLDFKITEEIMKLSLEKYDTFIPQQLFDEAIDKCERNRSEVQIGELIFTLFNY